jgi:hypothetical protein
MKKMNYFRQATITATLMLVAVAGYCQWSIPQPDNAPKQNYGAIIIYRQWEQHMVQHGDNMGIEYGWSYKFEGFGSVKEAVAWLNTNDWSGKPATRLEENELIGIYDLSTSKKIDVVLKTEEKSIPKHVEVQEEKWTEQHYEVSNSN